MSKVFRTFPALSAMGANVRDFISGQFSSERGEENLFGSVFESWVKPELAGHENTLLGKLVLEGGFGYKKSSVTLDSLSKGDCAVLHPSLIEMLEDSSFIQNPEYTVPKTRKPYTHQKDAFEAARNGKSVLVSAGTGSGKTECFLYPIISDILRETPEQRQQRGVRAIILYPTNALIHSQEQRLTEYLNTKANKDSKNPITFCIYNSGLPNETGSSSKSTFFRVNNRKDLTNVNTIPDIILTNFSMLEYVLLRQKDFILLSNAGKKLLNSQKTIFRHLVLDEAHTYTGANATEIALQIRRVILAMESAGGTMPSVQFYATSATFSGTDDDVKKFAKGLFFNVDECDVAIIKGNRFAAEVPAAKEDARLSLEDIEKLRMIEAEGASLEQICRRLGVSNDPVSLEEYLWRFAEVRKIREWLCDTKENRSYLFDDLCDYLKSDFQYLTKDVVAILLDVGSLAKFKPMDDDEYVPLLPTRWHSVFRKFEGLFACVNPNCTANPQRHAYRHKLGRIYSAWQEKCECGSGVYPLSFCRGCGKVHLMAEWDGKCYKIPSPKRIIGAFFDIDDVNDDDRRIEFLSLDDSDANGNNKQTFEGMDCYKIAECPCGYKLPAGSTLKHYTQTFVQNKPLFTSLVLEGLWTYLPEQDAKPGCYWPSNGRHILTFSDTRQNAAQLAPTMEDTFDRNSMYQMIYQILSELSPADKATIQGYEDLREKLPPEQFQVTIQPLIDSLKRKTACLTIEEICGEIMNKPEYLQKLGLVEDANDKKWNEKVQERQNKLRTFIAYTLLNLPPNTPSLENAGVIECVYEGLENCDVPDDFSGLINKQEWQDLLYLCLQSVRTRQAFNFADVLAGQIDYEEDFKEYFDFHNDTVKLLSKTAKENLIPKIFGKMANRLLQEGGNDCRLEKELFECAKNKWVDSDKRIYWQNIGGVTPIKFRLRNDNLYLCAKTKKVVFKNIRKESPFADAAIYEIDNMSGLHSRLRQVCEQNEVYSLFAAEHTAQMNVKENQNLERWFRNNRLNLLSSTTTMEMGIDVGALSSVMLANTPPTQANYMQRAGRAGRRGEGSTLIFTICNASPHDEMFYQHPDWAFKKSMSSPEISFESRNLLQRAVNAWIVRCICQEDAELQKKMLQTNNPIDSYSTFGQFFALIEQGRLDYTNKNALLYAVQNDANHLLRKQIVQLLGESSNWSESFDFSSEQSFIGKAIASLKLLLNDWNRQKQGLERERKALSSNAEYSKKQKDYLDRKLGDELSRLNGEEKADKLKDSTVSYLVEHQFFPSHGLPLDVVSLSIMSKKSGDSYYSEDAQFKLERGRAQAIRSYAPGNETIVWGKRYMSLGILTDYRQRLGLACSSEPNRSIYLCPTCKNIYIQRPENQVCPHCSKDEKKGHLIEQSVIIPEAFVSKNEKGCCKKGVRNPLHAHQIVNSLISGEFQDSYESTFTTTCVETNSVVHVFNEGQGRGFRRCTKCGRVLDANQDATNDSIAATMASCKHFWHPKTFFLYHHFTTESLMVKIKPDFYVGSSRIGQNISAANALGIALKTACSVVLGIEEGEIDFELPTLEQQEKCDIILYDTNVGGSGYLQVAKNKIDDILMYALKNVIIGDVTNHHNICNGACPKCLINYNTQFLFADRETAPNRLELLNLVNVEKILYCEDYNRYCKFKDEKKLHEILKSSIEYEISTAKNIDIVLPYISSEIFESAYWPILRNRPDETSVRFILQTEPVEDDRMSLKRIFDHFGKEAISICSSESRPGFYTQDKCFQLIRWKDCSVKNPFEESDGCDEWVVEELRSVPDSRPYFLDNEKPEGGCFAGETIDGDEIKGKKIEKVMEIFLEKIGHPNLDFSSATSWEYSDVYAKHPTDMCKKDACIAFIRAIGAGHLLNSQKNGLVVYSKPQLQRDNCLNGQLSWAQYALEDGNHQKEGMHDRFLRINLSDGSQYVLALGKGFASFVLENGKYVKKSGSVSWFVKGGK